MPNWVSNVVNFEGDAEEIERLKATVQSIGEAGDAYDFDFDKIIPTPKGLHDVVSGGLEDMAREICKKISHDPLGEILEDKMDMLLDKIKWPEWVKDIPKQKAMMKQYIKNFKETGYTSWYGWCCDKWGTKWNASDSQFGDNEVDFNTAWSTPVPVMIQLSKMFPTVLISVSFADEDLGSNCGRYDLQDGSIVDEYIPANADEALKYACDVRGEDYNEIVEERDQDC